MTELIYNEDAYIREFNAVVVECLPIAYNKQNVYDVILDRTAFFPEQGGQDCDSGQLFVYNDATTATNILHVSIKDDVIHHICDRNFKVGTKVHGNINWEQRFDRMQQHSGEHLVSGTVHRLFGADNVGFHLSEREVTLDFNRTFTDEELVIIEDTVNRAIYENRKTIILYPTEEELKEIDYRSKKEIIGQVRLVKFPGYDICACCAPHVGRTGEIGMIKIMNAENFKGGTRMWIRCGCRALTTCRSLLNDAREISQLTSVKIEEIVSAVKKLNDNYKSSKFDNIRLQRIILAYEADKLKGSTNPVLFTEGVDTDSIRLTLNGLAETSEGYCAAFTGNDDERYNFVIISNTCNCTELLDKMKEKLSAKGGGSAGMICGSVTVSKNSITDFWKTL